MHTNESPRWHACYPLSPSSALSNCARKMEKLHWIAVWVSFPRLGVSRIVFTSTKSTCFCQSTTYQTRVVHSEVALWLTRMSDLSRFVYIGRLGWNLTPKGWIGWGFCDIRNQGCGKCNQLRPESDYTFRGRRVITLAETLIIPDITKTEFSYCFIIHYLWKNIFKNYCVKCK